MAASLLVAACSSPGDNAERVAEQCGQQKCPAGTAVVETRYLSASDDINASYDPTTRAASGAYARMGSGGCEYACQVIQGCPADTFPVITSQCFTCGVIKDGKVDSSACTDEGKVATECKAQTCPTGTAPEDIRSVTAGYDLSQGYSASYDPDNAYQVFGTGDCSYACKVSFPCPEGAYPIVKSDCFTCTKALPDGSLAPSACDAPSTGGAGASGQAGAGQTAAGASGAGTAGAGGASGQGGAGTGGAGDAGQSGAAP